MVRMASEFLVPWKSFDCVWLQSFLPLVDLFPLVVAVPKSPREIKSYHLIDFSGLDVPQTQGRVDAPAFSSLLDGDRDFGELGHPAVTAGVLPLDGDECVSLWR